MTRLQAVEEREVSEDEIRRQREEAAAQKLQSARVAQEAATKMLMMAISALSQRFVVALSNLFTLVTVASAFYLWVLALPTMTWNQIIGLTIYSGFVLLVNIYGRRK